MWKVWYLNDTVKRLCCVNSTVYRGLFLLWQNSSSNTGESQLPGTFSTACNTRESQLPGTFSTACNTRESQLPGTFSTASNTGESQLPGTFSTACYTTYINETSRCFQHGRILTPSFQRCGDMTPQSKAPQSPNSLVQQALGSHLQIRRNRHNLKQLY